MKFKRSDARAALRVSLATGLALALGACTTLGTGTGSTSPGERPVSFAWKSYDGGVTGTMSATLAGGGDFTGTYREITRTTEDGQPYPAWYGWNLYWDDDATTTRYTGRVMANLQGPDSQRMDCRFELNDPLKGMDGGGQGQCQLPGGTSIDATFPRQP